MACKCAPALLVLRNEVDARWPGRDRASDGCCGDAAHAARKSDHNPDASGYAHAEDIDEDIVQNMGDRPLWLLGVRLLADRRTKYLIYERQLLYPDGTVKPYHGINAHEHHLHISIKPGTEHDTLPWLADAHGDDDLTDAERKQLTAAVEKLDAILTGKFYDLAFLDTRLKQAEDRIVARVTANLKKP